MEVPVYNMQGAEVGTMSIDEQSLGGTINADLIKQAFVMYHANRRQGSARTKSRSDVEGSTRKIYKQKGTGRARHRDRKPNIFRGGGSAHAKKRTREDYHLDMPKKMRRKANRNALLAKLVDGEVKIIDSMTLAEPKTKGFQALISGLKLDRAALVAVGNGSEGAQNVRLSARNVDDVTLCAVEQLTCFEMLNHRYLVIGKAELEAWLTGPSSQTGKSAKVEPMGRVERKAKRRRPYSKKTFAGKPAKAEGAA